MSFLKYSRLFSFFISSYFLSSLPALSSQPINESFNTNENIQDNNQVNFSQLSSVDGLSSNSVISINQDKQGYLWIATEDGLNRFDGKKFHIYRHDKNKQHSISDNVIRKIFIDSDNTLWIGTQHGLSRYNRELDNFDNYYHNELDDNSLRDNIIWDIYQDSNNLLWVATAAGLHTVDLTKHHNRPHHFNPVNITGFTKTLSKIKTIYQDNNQNYWFGGYDNGIHLANENLTYIGSLQTKNKVDLHVNANTLFDIEEIDGQLWLATNNGLFIVDLLSKSQYQLVSHINAQDMLQNDVNIAKNTKAPQTLLSNHVSAITQYDDNNVWLATNKGLNIINLLDDNISSQQYNRNSTSLSENSLMTIFKDKNNTLWLGTYGSGLTKHSPLSIKLNHGLAELDSKQLIAEPQFTDLYLANQKIEIKTRRATKINKSKSKQNSVQNETEPYSLTRQLNSLNQLSLKNNHLPVSFEFVSPNAKSPNQLSYRYRLTGLEDNWIDAGKDNYKATYTNLSSGYYTFEVQAYDLQSSATSKTNHLNIYVLPPWWLTSSAILIYTVMSILFISFIFQQIRHRRLYHWQIKENEERLKLSLWGSGDEMWDWNMTTVTIFRSNIWGKLEFPQDGSRNSVSDTQKDNVEESSEHESNIHQHDLARVKYALAQHISGQSEYYEATYRVLDKDNKLIWVLDRGKIVERDEEGQPSRMTGTLKDISQIKNTEARLKLFAKCIENISDAVVIYDKQFIAVDINKAFVEITGKDRDAMLGQPLTFSQYPDELCTKIKKYLITKGRWHGEIENLHTNGSKYFTDLNIDVIYDENGSISHFVGVFSDITKRKSTDVELRRLASSDTLTGLPNRAFFQANQTRLVNSKIPHALLVFDLDNFKKINDSLGHQVGDAILCKITERITNLGRKQDSIYRLGGDEFSILIENTNDIHTITSIANHILTTVAQPFKLKNQEVVLFSSIGVVLYPDDGATSHELLKNADTAMYHAKNSGGNKYQIFNDSMNKKAVHRLQVENLIRHGLKEDAFSVFYQPKISIATGKVSGMEALVRFQAPNNNIISPAVFIPVSEETGQIIDIGEIVLRKACFATKKWVDSGLFIGRVAVNLSAVQFTQSNLVSLIAEILIESNLPAKHLELEITEGTVMDDPQQAIATMEKIRAMGIHLSLDDFGTGYSSLAYLKKFPLNTLKIDKAFVDDIEVSEQGRNMVATIVTIAHNLDMEVVAEGVETTNQLSFLTGLGCEQLQGYLYSKPLPTDKFQQYLLSHKVTDKSTDFINR